MATNTASSEAGGTLPVYCKTAAAWVWPKDSRFYLLTGKGPFLCRRTPFFRSSVPVRSWQLAFASHEASVELYYPPVPGDLFERVVGFFDRVASGRPAEAVVLLTHHPRDGYGVVVPDQRSLVREGWTGEQVPVSVRYQIPSLPPEAFLVGSIHSHPGRLGAFSSGQDAADAQDHFPGLHFVVGELDREPPDLHCLFAVDGMTVDVADPYTLVQGYASRRHTFPPAWLTRVAVELHPSGPYDYVRPKRPRLAGNEGRSPRSWEVPFES